MKFLRNTALEFVLPTQTRYLVGLLVLMLSACATTPSGPRPTAKIDDIRDHKAAPTIQARPNKPTTPALATRPVPSTSDVETRPLRNVPEPIVALPEASANPRMVDSATAPAPARVDVNSSVASPSSGSEQERPPSSQSESSPPAVPPLAKLESLPAVRLPAQNNRAVASLLLTAERQKKAGELEGAVATLERALSIEPRNSVIWNRMAELRFEQGRYDQAAQLAAKSNLFVGANMALQARNYRLVALAKDTMGDRTAAAAALRQAEQLEELSQ